MNERETILFICTGNIYRSPTAEIIFNEEAQKQGLLYRAESAGVNVGNNINMSSTMVAALKQLRYHAEPVACKRLNEQILDASSLILCFESWHRESIGDNYPELYPTIFPRIHLLHEYVGPPYREVADPQKIIKRRGSFGILDGLPFALKKSVGINPSDYQAINQLCRETALQVQDLTKALVLKLRTKGLLR